MQPAFGERPLQPGQFWPGREGLSLTVRPVANSGRFAAELQGSLRSPTFRIDKKYLLFRVAGRDCRVRLIIDKAQAAGVGTPI